MIETRKNSDRMEKMRSLERTCVISRGWGRTSLFPLEIRKILLPPNYREKKPFSNVQFNKPKPRERFDVSDEVNKEQQQVFPCSLYSYCSVCHICNR
jgi:hypothetical protein